MLQVVTAVALAVGACSGARADVRQSQPRAGTIRTEFRVFDGLVDVSGDTRLRVRPSGSTETGRVLDGTSLSADLPAGLYDVQAVRQQAGHAVSVRWAERLVVMAYPDEGGRHLEVINFADQHGALQLRWAHGETPDPAGLVVAVAKAGQGQPVTTRTFQGAGYALLVLPAGVYDIRIARAGREPVDLPALEIPSGRTRMKLVR